MRTKTQRTNQRKARNYGAEAAAVRSLWCLCNAGLRAELIDIGDGDTDEIEDRWCSGAIVAAHVVSRGAGGGRFDIVPLCTKHHDEQHATGIETFAAAFDLDLRALADEQALAHEPPLGIRGLAARFAAERDLDGLGAGMASEFASESAILVRDHGLLVGYDLAALLSWVRRRMAEYTVGCLDVDRDIQWVWSPDDEGDREAMAGWLAVDLELGDEENFAPAYALCAKAGGWPS